MFALDYIVIVLYFIGLIAVSLVMSRRIKSSEDLFIAGRNSSWWLSGVSSYMTVFSASTFVVWGGVAYKSGLVAVVIAMTLGVVSLICGKWISGRWRQLRIKSPGEFLNVRFGHETVSFYTVSGIVARAVHTAVALYAVAVVVCGVIDLNIWWTLLILGGIALIYTVAGGFLAVLMTDVIQFGVLLAVVVFMIPLSLHELGGAGVFMERAQQIPGFLSGTSPTYTWVWLALWLVLNIGMIGGDWPFVQRYISVPTVKDARRSTYLIGILYFLTPIIWYLPTMICRLMEPGLGLDADPATMTFNGEHAYINMSKTVLMQGMVGMMLAAMLSATLSNFSGILNVFANVYTYEIWGRREKNRSADEQTRIRVGRIFTLCFGLTILGLSMLIPFAGGAEKVVVTLLTLVLCPLYLPSIWGLFSKRLSGSQLIWTMLASWAVGIAAHLLVPSDVLSTSLVDSISGGVLPIAILGVLELVSRARGVIRPEAEKLAGYIDPDASKEPDARMKRATKTYSHMAVSCFCITLGVIALLLGGLLVLGDPKTLAVKGIVLSFIASIVAIIVVYLCYRFLDKRKNECR
ncbi:MAG: sodium:solute symporter [Bacteroidales bacterium]|nr:sodium:solute symporter [Bacteroidales bacterium]